MTMNSFWKGKKVLVTGHTGFKGSWLTLWLISIGAEVCGYSLKPNKSQTLFTQLYTQIVKSGYGNGLLTNNEGNICDLEKLKQTVNQFQPDVVIHLAAQALVREGYLNPLDTWMTNVQGSLNVLEAIKSTEKKCAVVMITTDKVYENMNWGYAYRENDKLGGYDPYSASKAAAELAISSWRNSFCGNQEYQNNNIIIATARAGNVIGGGDWSKDRIIPDAIRALQSKRPIEIRNPNSTRPWQHVLEPLGGYLLMAENLYERNKKVGTSFNFGPMLESNKCVKDLIRAVLECWPGEYIEHGQRTGPYEAERLHLNIDKAYIELGWKPRWDFRTTIEKTINWYQTNQQGDNTLINCLKDLHDYQNVCKDHKMMRSDITD